MIRIYCDICEKEIEETNSFPGVNIDLSRGALTLDIEIGVCALINGIAQGHVCKYCVLDAINLNLDDRPKAGRCGP